MKETTINKLAKKVFLTYSEKDFGSCKKKSVEIVMIVDCG